MPATKKRRAARRRAGAKPTLTFADVRRALEGRDPRFAEVVVDYLAQPDPPENVPEGPPPDDAPELPDDAWTLQKLRGQISPAGLYGKSDEERWALRRAAWKSLLEEAEHPPPRLFLGDVLIELYQSDDTWGRQMLIDIFTRARLGWGIWRGFKRVYKLAEERHDAEMFGALAWRLDAWAQAPHTGEVSGGTALYMRRRAWRYLRGLGRALPELYPRFCVEVLRHYPRHFRFAGSWVANQIWAHEDLIGERTAWFDRPPADLSRRAFDAAWKASPEPLFRLLELAESDVVCQFAVRSLAADFAEALRHLEPAFLARLGQKRLQSIDEFIVERLEKTPELHQSKLAAVGLHDTAVGLLHSSSERAVRYAIDYCNAHAPSIPLDELLDLAEEKSGDRAILEFVAGRLEKVDAGQIGLPRLVRMLAIGPLSELAAAKIKHAFTPADLDVDTYVALATGDRAQQSFVASFYEDSKQKVPTAFLVAHAEHPSLSGYRLRPVMNQLGERSGAEIGADWIKKALFDNRFSHYVASWLRAGMLRGADLDVDWLKGLVARPSWRGLALELLGDTRLVAPHRIGSDYLLRAARHSDERVSEFAHRYLLQHFTPGDFALEKNSDDVAVGVAHIFTLLGPEQPAPVRRFAATYLLVHHPELSATREESRNLGIEPQIDRDAYSIERLGGLLFDGRADVRRFAAEIARVELTRWNAPALAYSMASSPHREPRVVGAETLLSVGKPGGPPESWLQSEPAFAMAESPVKATREIALTLIRRHYKILGSPERLARLMDSPDREVRLFAVRLLWDQHRPLPGPRGDDRDRFDSVEALRQFLRTVLFGLPPGRMERRDAPAGGGPERPLPASVAKRRLVDVVRDMAVEDGEFAAVAMPVLEAFLASAAKGEWQACVAAVARIRRAHPSLETALPPALPMEAASGQ